MDLPARQVFHAYDPTELQASSSWHCERCGVSVEETRAEGVFRRCAACGHVRYRNPEPAVSVLVTRGNDILLCRRRGQAFEGGRWCLPCGYIDWGEDFLSAARREVREETGIEVRITGLLSIVSNFLSPAKHSLVAVLHGEPLEDGAVPVGGDDAELARWHDHRADLPDMAFEADTHIIERFFANDWFAAPVDEAIQLQQPEGT